MKTVMSGHYADGQNTSFVFDGHLSQQECLDTIGKTAEFFYFGNLIHISEKEYDVLLSEREYCGCGYGSEGICLHEVSTGECCRKIVSKEREPHSFGTERLVPSIHAVPIECCTVDGQRITVYTLKYQRGYHQHESGRWSMPKDEESIDSLSSTGHY